MGGGGGRGLSDRLNTRSFLAPLKLILAMFCLAAGVQLTTTSNLGGYIPFSSLSLSVCNVVSSFAPTKKVYIPQHDL